MKKIITLILLIVFASFFVFFSCKKKIESPTAMIPISLNTLEVAFDSTQIKTFFEKYPKLSPYQADVEKLYRKHQFHYIWFDKDGLNEFSNILYNKVNNLNFEGIETEIPYKEILDRIYNNPEKNKKATVDTPASHAIVR